MQLLCIARAILRQQLTGSKIVLVDEAMSKLDMDEDLRLQGVMADAFSECTVITISHRLHAMHASDMVLRMEEGKIIDVLKRDPRTGVWRDN